jgi:hypothetical protein
LKDIRNAEKSLKRAKLHALDVFQKEYYERILDNMRKNPQDNKKTAG